MVRLGLNPAETPLSSVVNWMDHTEQADRLLWQNILGDD